MSVLIQFIRDISRRGLEKFGRYYSSYRGVVHTVDDPNNAGRVRVIVPQVAGHQPLTEWAYPKNGYSGIGFGSYCQPVKGQVVWVEFEFGDPRKPIWSFGPYASGQMPTGFKPGDIGLKTPYGAIVILRGDNYFILKLNSDIFLEINDTGVIVNYYGSKILLEENQISLESNVRIGSKDGANPLLKGNDTKTLLDKLISQLTNIEEDRLATMGIINATVGGALSPYIAKSQARLLDITEIKANLNSILSTKHATNDD